MTDKPTPFIDDVRFFLADGIDHAVLEFELGPEVIRLALGQELVQLLIGRLGDLSAQMETRRRQIDPTAGQAGDAVRMTAVKPETVRVATVPGTEDGAVIFQTLSGPKAFLMPKQAMTDLAHQLLREAERSVPPHRLNN